MIAALAPADRAALYRLGEAVHRAAALGDRRWAAFADVRSHVEGLMTSIRPDCGADDVEAVAKRLVGTVDYREGADAALLLAYVEILAHGRRWPAEALS
jgi:hypothetical protein